MVDTLAAAPNHPTTELELDWSCGLERFQRMEHVMVAALSRPALWTSLKIIDYSASHGYENAGGILRAQLPSADRLRSFVIDAQTDNRGFYVSSTGPPTVVGALEPDFVSFSYIDRPELDFSLNWSKIRRYEEHWTRLHCWNLPAQHLRQMQQLTHLVLEGACMPDGPVTFPVLLILQLELRRHSRRGPGERGVDPLANIVAPALQKLSVRAGLGLRVGHYVVSYMRRTPHTDLTELVIYNTDDDVLMQLWEVCPGLRVELCQPSDDNTLPVPLLRLLATRRQVGQLVVHMGERGMDNLGEWLEALERVLANGCLRIRIERHWWGNPPFPLAQWGDEYSALLRRYPHVLEHKDHITVLDDNFYLPTVTEDDDYLPLE